MIIVGLTGSIGMGKSTTSAMFREYGIPVYDADRAVHRLYAGAAVAPMASIYPEAIVEGKIDRTVLSRLVMSDSGALRKIEAVVHPLVGVDRATFMERYVRDGAPAVVFDVPLLFETGGDKNVDVVAVVSASAQIQKRRVLARPDMTPEKFATIVSKQLPDAEKRRRAHYVVDTGRGLDPARRQVAGFIASLGV
jgi:dephospho-CoA kinase